MWTILLNWIVQGVIVATATADRSAADAARRAATRVTRVLDALVAAVLALPLVPLSGPRRSPRRAVPSPRPMPSSALVAAPLERRCWTRDVGRSAGLWMLWICCKACALCRDVRGLHRARRDCRPLPAPIAARLRPSTARAAGEIARRGSWCRATCVPAAVLGGGPPVIAVAPACSSTLDRQRTRTVVVHEWAHVLRRDRLWRTLVAAASCTCWSAGIPPCGGSWAGCASSARWRATNWSSTMTGSAKAYATCLTRVASLAAALERIRLGRCGALSSPG